MSEETSEAIKPGMNFLYTLFDCGVYLGRVTMILLLIGALMFFGSFLLFQVFMIYGAGFGGLAFTQMMENPPEFVQDFMTE